MVAPSSLFLSLSPLARHGGHRDGLALDVHSAVRVLQSSAGLYTHTQTHRASGIDPDGVFCFVFCFTYTKFPPFVVGTPGSSSIRLKIAALSKSLINS